jgi:hypothetical protein
LPHVERFDSLAVARTMQLGNTKVTKHSEGVVAYFRSHLKPNLSQWKEGSHDSYLWLWVSKGAAPNLFVCMVYVAPIGSKHENESMFQNLVANIVEVQILGGIVLLGGDFNARTTTYQIPLTLMTFVNCYKHLSLLRLSNQALWLRNKIVMLMLTIGAACSWTYVVTLGCSSSMAGHLATNQGSSFAWQMRGVTLSIILLAHLQFGKLLHTLR